MKNFSHCTFDYSDNCLQRPLGELFDEKVTLLLPSGEQSCQRRPFLPNQITYILRSNRNTLELGYPEYLLNKPIVSSRSSLNTLLEDGFTIAGLLTPVMANIPFLWSRSTIL